MSDVVYQTLRNRKPLWTHDCEECRFAGSFSVSEHHAEDTDGREPPVVTKHDVWLTCEGSLLIRDSSDGPDYHSFPLRTALSVAEKSRKWKLALDMAQGVPTHEADKVFVFSDTGEAYDSCQCLDELSLDGQTLLIPSEKVVGLSGAWPLAVTVEQGKLHALQTGYDPTERGNESCTEKQARDAVRLADGLGWAIRPEFERFRD